VSDVGLACEETESRGTVEGIPVSLAKLSVCMDRTSRRLGGGYGVFDNSSHRTSLGDVPRVVARRVKPSSLRKWDALFCLNYLYLSAFCYPLRAVFAESRKHDTVPCYNCYIILCRTYP